MTAHDVVDMKPNCLLFLFHDMICDAWVVWVEFKANLLEIASELFVPKHG